MIDLLQKEISDCLTALQQPNNAIDNYRCYWEGRKALAEELLLKLQQCNVSSSADFGEDDYNDEDEFQPCSRCDGHDACADFGCAFELGLGHMVHQEPCSDWD